MKSNWLITTAAAAILASTGLATAQTNDRAGKSAPSAQPQMQGQAQGQVQGKEMGKGERAMPRAGAQGSDQTTGQAPADSQPSSTAQQDQKPSTAGQAPAAQQKQGSSGAQQQQKQQDADAKAKSETTGRGDAQGASLNSEQRTKIREVVINKKIPKVDKVNFSVNIGARVPRAVRFHPIPVEIVEIHPAWRGYRVVLVGTELLIIDPSTYEIVAIVVV